MKQQGKRQPQPENGHIWDEADIGSGEQTPGQQETEQLIRQIPALPERRPAPAGGETGEAAS